MEIEDIDITFDFSIETSGEKPDIDRDSSTLCKYHRLLWNKRLPNGEYPNLNEQYKNVLEIDTKTCKTILSSDTMINNYTGNWNKKFDLRYLQTIKEKDEFIKITHKIGNFIMYPRTRINKKDSFNQARGRNPKIHDRFDLSLECIKRYYDHDKNNPLQETIERYKDFFQLFRNFKSYCKFFFLDDLTKNDYTEINHFLTFNDFKEKPIPRDADQYRQYMNNATEFINKRIKRIQNYINNYKK